MMVLEQAPGSVMIMDTQMNFEYLNPMFTQLSGYTKEDLLHKNINSTVYKGKTPESRADVVDALRKGEKWQGELLTYHKTDLPYWANTIASPYRDEQGNVEGYIIIQQDISEHKKMEIALRESEILYRTLIEKSLNGVSITRDRRFFLVNEAFCNILGYSKDELMEIQPESLLAPEDRERVLDIHDKRMRGELDTLNYVSKFVHKSGKLLTVEMSSTTVQVDGQNASFVTIRDITERIQSQEALSKSEQKYRELTELLPQAIYELDAQGNPKYMNKAGMKIFGIEDGTGDKKAFDFFVPDDLQRMKQALKMEAARMVSEEGVLDDH
jgi:PAS domain S-box-containing protein